MAVLAPVEHTHALPGRAEIAKSKMMDSIPERLLPCTPHYSGLRACYSVGASPLETGEGRRLLLLRSSTHRRPHLRTNGTASLLRLEYPMRSTLVARVGAEGPSPETPDGWPGQLLTSSSLSPLALQRAASDLDQFRGKYHCSQLTREAPARVQNYRSPLRSGLRSGVSVTALPTSNRGGWMAGLSTRRDTDLPS